jgi:chemotaxis protein MotB
MQADNENWADDQPRKSTGMIRGAIFGILLLLAAFGLIAAISKLTGNHQNETVSLTAEIDSKEESKTFNRLVSEWMQAKDTLQDARKIEASLAQLLSKSHANEVAQAAILKEASASFSRSVETVASSSVKAENADVEVSILLDDALESRVANATGNLETYSANRKRAAESLQVSKREVERINAAVVELRKASKAAGIAAKANATVARAADAAQIVVDQNEDVVPDSDGSGLTLFNLRNDFFNEAKAQADTADRAASAAAKALVVSTQELDRATGNAADRQAALEFIQSEEEQSAQELTALSAQLKSLQVERAVAQKTAAIAHERLATEQSRLSQKKEILTEETLKSEALQATSKESEKEHISQEIKVGAAQQIYDDAELKLRDAQKLRAKRRAVQIAEVNSEMHDRLRATLGNLNIENPDHDRFIVPSAALFTSGSAQLGDNGKALVLEIAQIISSITARMPDDADWILRVDGHTDATPLKVSGNFKDNWELSQARALAIVRSLVKQGNMPPERLAANGLGEYQPLKSGDSEQDKAENRRIELVLVPR